ncbi:MAG: chorismate synthase, partial [Ignavibacteriae bacterium]|nr:chorismate synthase [Ignavibacteriota bacterium]
FTKQVGNIVAKEVDFSEIENNPVRCADKETAKRMERAILKVKKEGDSLGGVVEAVITGVPAGLGEPVFDKLEADLAKALLSIPAIKGFEIGSGFAAAKMKASEHNDEFYKEKKTGKVRTKTNFAGGILGGISNGEDIVVRVAVKPPSSILKPQETVDTKGKKRTIKVEGRHDPCLCPRAVPVVESMIALVLADHLMRQTLTKHQTGLARIREEIDIVDDMLLLLLAQRMELVSEVGKWKRNNKKSIPDKKREEEILQKRLFLAKASGLDATFIKELYHLILHQGKIIQAIV